MTGVLVACKCMWRLWLGLGEVVMTVDKGRSRRGHRLFLSNDATYRSGHVFSNWMITYGVAKIR
jgi:hypothetical protein